MEFCRAKGLPFAANSSADRDNAEREARRTWACGGRHRLWTLRYGDEVRDPNDYFGKLRDGKIDADLMKLVTKLIEDRIAPWDPKMTADPVQARLLDIIAEKKKGRKRPMKTKAEAAAPPSNVISIMDALKKEYRLRKQA
jgi:DNA end-binding protein Ku